MLKKFFVLFSLGFYCHASVDVNVSQVEVQPTEGFNSSINFRTNPLYLAGGMWNLSAELPIDDEFTIAPTYLYSKGGSRDSLIIGGTTVTDSTINLSEHNLGLELNWYLRGRNQHSLVVAPALYLSQMEMKQSELSGRYRGNGLGIAASLQVSYYWVWDSGLNFRIGSGLRYNATRSFRMASTTNSTRIDTEVPSLFGNGLSILLEAGLGFYF